LEFIEEKRERKERKKKRRPMASPLYIKQLYMWGLNFAKPFAGIFIQYKREKEGEARRTTKEINEKRNSTGKQKKEVVKKRRNAGDDAVFDDEGNKEASENMRAPEGETMMT
jgi:hypothetical protein